MSNKTSWDDIPGTRCFQSYVPAVAAATATISYPIFCAPRDLVITHLEIVPQDAVSGAADNYRELNFLVAGTGGTGTTEIGSYDLDNGNDLVALDGKEITLAADVAMVEGDTLVLKSAKVGDGILVPALLIYIEYYIP